MPAAASPDLALRAAKATVDLYSRATETMLAEVARRLARGIDGPGWAEAKLLETAALRDRAVAELDRLTQAAPGVVREAIRTGWTAGQGDVAREVGAITVRTSTGAVDRLVWETVGRVTSTHGRILRSTMDAYREVIAETSAADVLTGTRTRVQAASQALDRFAARGITGFVDRRGRQWGLDSYVEMATRTAVGRAQVAGALDRYWHASRNLVIVSDAPAECEACRPWEGKVLSIGGAGVGETVEGGDGATFTVTATVDQAQQAGLHHPNCRHRLGAFVPGLTRRMVDTADPEGDAARQEQRRLERGVRQWRRREAAALTDDDRRRAGRHRRQWQGRVRAHVDGHDLRRRHDRER